MAPCSTDCSRSSHKDMKLRKPVVEKMRRDRINSCIEQLKVILEKEFHQQEPNSKLEKADILEMTVNFLKQQLQSGVCQDNQGFSHCWRDSVAPLQGLQKLHQAQRSSTSILRPSTLQDSSSSRDPIWRPW